MPYKDKEEAKKSNRERQKRYRALRNTQITPTGTKDVTPVTPEVTPCNTQDITPVTPSVSGVFIPLEPCYIDLLEQEYRKYGGLAKHIGKLLIAKAKEVNERIESGRPAVEPIDPIRE